MDFFAFYYNTQEIIVLKLSGTSFVINALGRNRGHIQVSSNHSLIWGLFWLAYFCCYTVHTK